MTRTMPAAAACILMAGCGARYHVELWNDTGAPLTVALVERWPDGIPASDRPRATVAPGGWFDYEVEAGRCWRHRFVEVWPPDDPAQRVDLDMTGRQVYRGRVAWTGACLAVEPIRSAERRLRRGR